MIDYWASKTIDDRLCDYLHLQNREELLNRFDVDFRYIEGPTYTGKELEKHEDGSQNDIWGVPRKKILYGVGNNQGYYSTVVNNPLKDIETVLDVESYSFWPNPDDFDYSIVKEQCEDVINNERVVMFMGDRLNRVAQLKLLIYLRGMEKALSDMVRKQSTIFDAILDKICSFYHQYLKNILKAAGGKIDILVTGDDFGSQEGMLCSPRVWRKKLMPGFQQYIKVAKSIDSNLKVMHHSCGSIFPIIPDMIDSGLDILNPIQPNTANMDHIVLKEKFGENIIFHGGVSLQGPLRFGPIDRIYSEIESCCNNLGKNGAYIMCTAHNINADINTPNILALFDAYKQFAPY
jgi:uroporphyrinogen decarboxylase